MRYDRLNTKRNIQSIDGEWGFSLERNFLEEDFIAVPGCWDTTFKFSRYRGQGYYKKNITVLTSGQYRIVFDGVANQAKVLLDGKAICEHYGPHTRFYTAITYLDEGEHELIVEVDNSFGDHNTLLEEKCGWYCFGGIHRSVWLEKLQDVFIETARIRCKNITPATATVCIAVELNNISNSAISDTINATINGTLHKKISFKLDAKERKKLAIELSLETPTLWSPENPVLYELNLSIERDDYRSKFGVRKVECSKGKILLNGKEIFIKGINHHDYQPLTGHTQTLAQMKYDLDIIKDMGCNLIRTSHYPKDETFLDLCDEMGILVWTEATGWQNTPAVMTKPLFEQQCTQCIEEMVREQYNHPSIIIWGLLNEVRSEFEEVRPIISRLINRFRKLDSSRPVTFATNRLLHNKDKMLDLVDIISPNLYTGWYNEFYGEDAIGMDEAKYFDKLLKWFDSEGLADKPILIGEFGAGGIAGFHSFAKERWSEESQADMLKDALDVYTTHPRCTGAIVWLFSDTLCSENEGLFRPYSHNCKGIVDAYRRPKMSYNVVKKYFSAKLLIKLDDDCSANSLSKTMSIVFKQKQDKSPNISSSTAEKCFSAEHVF